MQSRHTLLPLLAVLSATACTVNLPAAPRSIAPTQPVFVTSGPAGKNPIIQSFTANPTNVTKGQPITFQVVAYDPNGEVLQFNWSATDGLLSANTGQAIIWSPPEQPGVYTVSVTVTNGRGGAVTGSQNLTVRTDGSTERAEPTAPPPSTPSPTPSPAPTAVASPSPSVIPPSPSPTASVPPAAPSSTTSTVGGTDLRFHNFPLSDFAAASIPSSEKTQGVTFRVKSATEPVSNYRFLMAQMLTRYEDLQFMHGSVNESGFQEFKGISRGVYMLEFYKHILPAQLAPQLSTFVGAGVDVAYYHSVLHPAPLARSNWQGNIPADKPDLNGAMFVFKYEEKNLDLGTFELP